MDSTTTNMAERLGQVLLLREEMLVTAESCTGGGLAELVTQISGSSQWFERGYITYSNEAKRECLGVRLETLETSGAVSEETALEMAQGAIS
ncbi:MAG: nicotinamide-nucleotide amidohydrolase family protein, partial [Proteobacteria bacterium]|nr:nicotinamide-nucleotide amidohydrolase family protein [Pseudomonadota bacterium]